MRSTHFGLAVGATISTLLATQNLVLPTWVEILGAVSWHRPPTLAYQTPLASTAVIKTVAAPDLPPPPGPPLPLVMQLPFNRLTEPNHLVIVGLHDFGDNATLNGLTYPQFEAYVQRVKALGYQNLTSKKLLNFLYGQEPVEGKWIMFTFDDGYLGQLEAATILQAHGYTAVLGIISNHVIAGGKSLNQAQIEAMLAQGHELASHTSGHCALALPSGDRRSFLPSPPGPEQNCNPDAAAHLSQGEIAFQLKDSKAVMEKTFGVPIRTIIYPYGFYNDAVLAEAHKAGYRLGFRFPSRVNPDLHGYTSPLDLPRLNVQRGSLRP